MASHWETHFLKEGLTYTRGTCTVALAGKTGSHPCGIFNWSDAKKALFTTQRWEQKAPGRDVGRPSTTQRLPQNPDKSDWLKIRETGFVNCEGVDKTRARQIRGSPGLKLLLQSVKSIGERR